MSTLIIGGLFALAILAIIGLVFLLRSEPRTSKKTPMTKVNNESLQASETAQVASAGAPTQPGLPAPREEVATTPQVVPVPQHTQRFPIANGQFHRLSDELHALHTQAQEIEQRLGVLTEMLERIENDQRQYTNVDGQGSHAVEPVSVN